MTVPDDRAVGGLLRAGDTVDVFVTLSVLVPQSLIEAGKLLHGQVDQDHVPEPDGPRQDDLVLRRQGARSVAEEISHLQASGAASFSFALRPPSRHPDRRRDAARRDDEHIIQRYGLPVPVVYPSGSGGVVLPGSTLPPSPSPAPSSASPSPSAP